MKVQVLSAAPIRPDLGSFYLPYNAAYAIINAMSKVADYLRGHITGEVTTRSDVREALETDLGVLKLKPEIVVYPRTTNDVRKVVRFAWQLAEKGHVLPVTVRGAGTNTTGAALGKGVSVVTTAHMNRIYEYDAKQHLVRLQPGATVTSLAQALSLHGSGVMPLAGSYGYGTVGGAIGDGSSGLLAGKYGRLDSSISKLEVVLANGDVIQTGRISKRELNKKKGLEGFEGDIYRGVERITEDYADIFDKLRVDDSTGYNAIADVKQKDGSMDLTPLFVASQGTLGIITEMILKTEPRSTHYGVAAVAYKTYEDARDALDSLCELKPSFIEYFDARLFDEASKQGKQYDFYEEATKDGLVAVAIVLGFDDFTPRARSKSLRKAEKIAEMTGGAIVTKDGDDATDMLSALDVAYYASLPDHAEAGSPPVFGDFQVPAEHFEAFTNDLSDLEQSLRLPLPLSGHVYTGVYSVHPSLHLNTVGDKQKVFKLLGELSKIVIARGGTMASGSGEGRLKAHFVYPLLDERLIEMYGEIRSLFDPRGTLNPGVKQDNDIRKLADMLRNSHDAGQLARFGLR